MEAVTEYDPAAGFTYSIVAQGGSERIRRRVLTAVLEAEQENSTRANGARQICRARTTSSILAAMRVTAC